MNRKIIIFGLAFVSLLLLLFILLRNPEVLKNLKIRTTEQVKEEEKKYAFKNSPFYKEYYTSDQLIVLNLWATWCEPCLTEIPILNKVKNHYSNQNKIVFLSLSLDDDSAKLKSFLKSNRFQFQDITLKNFQHRKSLTDYLNGNKTYENSFIKIRSNVLPTTYILRDQKIINVYTAIDSNKIYRNIDSIITVAKQ
ncbi:hypothetical protein B0A69_16700 [Chryseobacterium shigense]|uniref:Thioredoxin-like n=1 Tax=Chryseobacterium shigense TaxID=297244 RepID=A0A1N7HX79_9FLAO|nr:TlpA disulfide reductase family protein [Chryseobacterium shigense]PQA92057.1 hypothetical protein B0A69_16700 [Chryseobacterium shigense]SIS29426.1 Thioredoxin-like [Chryseobacterium shigense]